MTKIDIDGEVSPRSHSNFFFLIVPVVYVSNESFLRLAQSFLFPYSWATECPHFFFLSYDRWTEQKDLSHCTFVTTKRLFSLKKHTWQRLGRRRDKIPTCSLNVLLKEEMLLVLVEVSSDLNNFVANY